MNWILVTNEAPFAGALAALKASGSDIAAVVVGPKELADQVATSGVASVLWADSDGPVEACAPIVAQAAADQQPGIVLTSSARGARSIASAVAAAIDATVLPGITSVQPDASGAIVEQLGLRGRVIETVQVSGAVVGFFGGEDMDLEAGAAADVSILAGEAADISVEAVQNADSGAGLAEAQRVVAVGRGLKAKDDLALIEQFAAALGAEIGSSMPVADDLGWVAKDHYIGRSGQHISPRLYMAVGISGAPQHMEGVRGAKIVAAINSDPDARVFRSADYGIVGDLYDVIPAIISEITN